ncbi:hypothetical protein WJX84_008769 [Apatococcus fuscideae]|uniref:Uncharacterized protein n=1 Tax=Apatococcus fuscideae TaxID=2026836 RepID=A0AAW1TGF0_9CHLO
MDTCIKKIYRSSISRCYAGTRLLLRKGVAFSPVGCMAREAHVECASCGCRYDNADVTLFLVDLVNGTNSQVASRQRPAERQAAPAELAVSGQWPTVLWPRPSLAACTALQLDQADKFSSVRAVGDWVHPRGGMQAPLTHSAPGSPQDLGPFKGYSPSPIDSGGVMHLGSWTDQIVPSIPAEQGQPSAASPVLQSLRLQVPDSVSSGDDLPGPKAFRFPDMSPISVPSVSSATSGISPADVPWLSAPHPSSGSPALDMGDGTNDYCEKKRKRGRLVPNKLPCALGPAASPGTDVPGMPPTGSSAAQQLEQLLSAPRQLWGSWGKLMNAENGRGDSLSDFKQPQLSLGMRAAPPQATQLTAGRIVHGSKLAEVHPADAICTAPPATASLQAICGRCQELCRGALLHRCPTADHSDMKISERHNHYRRSPKTWDQGKELSAAGRIHLPDTLLRQIFCSVPCWQSKTQHASVSQPLCG